MSVLSFISRVCCHYWLFTSLEFEKILDLQAGEISFQMPLERQEIITSRGQILVPVTVFVTMSGDR